MVMQPIHLRKSLLAQDPQNQMKTAASFGLSAPHRELPLIASTFALDQQGQQRLQLRSAKRLINATSQHLSNILALTPAAQQDIIEKAQEVLGAASHWAVEHFAYSGICDHLMCLKESIAWAKGCGQ